jgi:transcriptional regulator GlxA family with amidase domain
MATELAILLFDGLTALDAVGPYEVLSRVPGVELHFVAKEPGVKRSDNGRLAMVADRAIDDARAPDIVLVPGGHGEARVREDAYVLDWLRRAHETTQFTTSVCTGALVLGAAGLLDGLEATTHWMSRPRLAEFGARPVERRVVEQGKVITAAGVSAGIDMALVLVARMAGPEVAQAIQLGIEYDPQPPFDAGSPEKAPAAIVEAVRQVERAEEQEAAAAAG